MTTVSIRRTSFWRCVDHGLVRVLERLDDLLVVVEDVPDALGRVDDVVEVELELLRQEPLDVALEQPQGRALRLDDLAVADDLLLDVRDVADDLVGAPSKMSSSSESSLCPILSRIGKQ